jgi:hypothetical protein
MLGGLITAGVEAASRTVSLSGQRERVLVSTQQHNGLTFVDLTALAPAIGLLINVRQDQIAFRNRIGEEWIGRVRENILIGPRRMIARGPVLTHGSSVYTTVDDAIEISASGIVVEKAAEVIRAGRAAVAREQQPTGDGWKEFTLEKTEEEKEAYANIYAPKSRSNGTNLPNVTGPPSRDDLWLQLSQGYVQGADFGTDINGSGNLAGFQTNFWAQTTQGPNGLELLTGHMSLRDPSTGWEVQGGDLFSDIWGWARGARFRWNAGDRRSPAVSYYAQARQRGVGRHVFTYSDRFTVNRWMSLAGEVATDGSAMGRFSLRSGRFHITPFYRATPGEDSSRGVYGAFPLFKGASLFGGFTRSQTTLGSREWKSLGLRVPLKRKVSLTLERTFSDSPSNLSAISALSASFPIGKIRFYGRYQVRDTEIRRDRFGFLPMMNRNHEFLSAFGYYAGRRLNIQMQTTSRWRRDGAIDQWQQVVGTYQASNKTVLEFFTILPTATTPNQSRIRLTRQISKTLALVTEWGNVSPYQGIEADPEERRLKIMIRKQWPISTRTRGGDIQGVVRDSLGQPLQNVLVRLGDYGSLTDDSGGYRFQRVPDGTFQLRVDEASLPADYAVLKPAQEVEVGVRSDVRIDFSVTPLRVIQGRVCWDKNDNRQCDPDEGLSRVPIYLGRRITATREAGIFMFHNLSPGRHTVRLKLGAARAKEWIALSPTEVDVELEFGLASRRIEFLLKKKTKPVVYQRLD